MAACEPKPPPAAVRGPFWGMNMKLLWFMLELTGGDVLSLGSSATPSDGHLPTFGGNWQTTPIGDLDHGKYVIRSRKLS